MDKVADIYAAIPAVNCKGKCHKSCGPIACSAIEADIMRDNGINPPSVCDHPTNGKLTCSHLDKNNRCSIYESRPLVCRLFGAIKEMKCKYGCVPEGGYLSNEESLGLISRMSELSGNRPQHVAIDLTMRDKK